MASDMRLNDKPIAKDGAYIYAEAADGSQIKISKADLASVVAEQMNNVEYEVSSDDAVVIAQEVLSKVTSLMFNVIANGSTRSLVSGYVYPNKLYGLITVSKYDGSVTIVTLNNGSFTKS